MSVIRVNPDSIHTYARTASDQFSRARSSMQQLANDVVGVHYFGPNAFKFKSECGTLLDEYAKKLKTDLAQISNAVRVSTSNIAASLGGTQINIAFDESDITVPQPAQGDGSVDIDVSALEQLRPVVQRHFGEIVTSLDTHFRALESTDWQGQAKETAKGVVSEMTSKAKTNAAQAEESIVRFINDQISAAQAADK